MPNIDRTIFKNMKKFLIPIVLLLLAAGNLHAQESKITTGVVAFQGQDYEKAIKAFDEGLKDPSGLKEKTLPKAYYYRAMSNLMWMGQMGTPEKVEAHKDQLEGILFRIYGDFKKSKETDTQDKWTKKVDQQLGNFGYAMLRGGLEAMEKADDESLSKAEQKKVNEEVIKYMDVVEEIDPTIYTANDVRAQAQLALGDSTKAYNSFKAAGKKFSENPPKQPDQLIAYVYYRQALLDRYMKNDIDAALADLEMGKASLDAENARFVKMKADMPQDRWEAVMQQYMQAKEYLTKFELDLLLNSPEKLDEALGKFETAIAREPKNYILHVAYAQLLEKTDLDKAEKIYLMATEIDPKKQIAWFNLGALYVNRGVAKYKESNGIADDYEKAKALQVEGDNYYKKAFPFLKNSLEIDKCDKESLSAILNICINLSTSDDTMAAEYKKYKDIQTECNK
jgi:hypothetical protein